MPNLAEMSANSDVHPLPDFLVIKLLCAMWEGAAVLDSVEGLWVSMLLGVHHYRVRKWRQGSHHCACLQLRSKKAGLGHSQVRGVASA